LKWGKKGNVRSKARKKVEKGTIRGLIKYGKYFIIHFEDYGNSWMTLNKGILSQLYFK
jgi:hypothetical protein